MNPIGPGVRREIEQRLQQIEANEDIEFVIAVESGSRAWGFASPDSDYDVRFIYRRPLDWYLSIDLENRRDVIEQPLLDEFDIGGWDLRKSPAFKISSSPRLIVLPTDKSDNIWNSRIRNHSTNSFVGRSRIRVAAK